MAHIVLFHSALGLRPAVHRFADALRVAGHQVTTPDLFEGAVFDRLEDGVARRDALGIEELARRTLAAVEELPSDLLYAGFSMGAASAQMLAMTRPGARGAVLMHAALPAQLFGQPGWPDAVPAQLHFAEDDPWVDAAVVAALASPALEVFRYAGNAHLFADDDGDDYVEPHAQDMLERVVAFVAQRASAAA